MNDTLFSDNIFEIFRHDVFRVGAQSFTMPLYDASERDVFIRVITKKTAAGARIFFIYTYGIFIEISGKNFS